jgi:DNA-binding transcriptional MocR family regulator
MNPSPSRKYLYEEVASRIAHWIEQGTFRPGERIPSVRQMSLQEGVSVNTILQAYLILEARGLIEARPQSGYYVRSNMQTALLEPEMSTPEKDPSRVSLHELTLMLLGDTQNPNLVQLGTALPNPDLLPIRKINHILNSVVRQHNEQGNLYTLPPGIEALRLQIAHRMVTSGCDVSPADIVITSGGIEAIDLCLRAVCRPGDIVAVESPTYFGTLQSLEANRLRALEIPTHPREGISLDALQFAIEHTPVRACLVISNFSNPLGSCIPDEKKKELVQLLARCEIPLIENDAVGELYFQERRPKVAKAFDQAGLVLLCSSFSKDISPGLRIGWSVPGRFKAEVEWLKFTTSVGVGTFPQLAVAQYLASGNYDYHLRRIRREYAYNVSMMSQAVMRYFPPETRLTRPSGGFVLWIQLPEPVDSLELYALALKGGITLTPGYVFSATQQYSNFIRLNAACWSYEIERAIERLGVMIAELASRRPAIHPS